MTEINEEDKKIIEDTNAKILFDNKWMKDEKDFIKFVKHEVEINNTKTSIRKCIEDCTSPAKEDIFNAFKIGKPENVRVLIIGQDPYPNKAKAHGYAFSVANGKRDASLLNIFKALQAYKTNQAFDKIENSKVESWGTNLATWANNNGVLLLNTALTYQDLYPDRKKNKLSKEEKEIQNKCQDKHIATWNPFIKEVIHKLLSCNEDKLVVFLWGDKAKATFFDLIKEKKTYMSIQREMLVLISNHPSNSSVNRGGNFPILAPNHFRACNDFLGKSERIKWEDI